MRSHVTQFSTLSLGGTFEAPLARIYAVFSETSERAKFNAAADRMIFILEEADFRVGGREIFRFGPKSDPRLRGQSIYHDIVPGCRIVSTETFHDGDTCECVAATTMEFKALDHATRLKITAQIVSLDGADAGDGPNARYEALLDNLGRYFGISKRSQGHPFSVR